MARTVGIRQKASQRWVMLLQFVTGIDAAVDICAQCFTCLTITLAASEIK